MSSDYPMILIEVEEEISRLSMLIETMYNLITESKNFFATEESKHAAVLRTYRLFSDLKKHIMIKTYMEAGKTYKEAHDLADVWNTF